MNKRSTIFWFFILWKRLHYPRNRRFFARVCH